MCLRSYDCPNAAPGAGPQPPAACTCRGFPRNWASVMAGVPFAADRGRDNRPVERRRVPAASRATPTRSRIPDRGRRSRPTCTARSTLPRRSRPDRRSAGDGPRRITPTRRPQATSRCARRGARHSRTRGRAWHSAAQPLLARRQSHSHPPSLFIGVHLEHPQRRRLVRRGPHTHRHHELLLRRRRLPRPRTVDVSHLTRLDLT
jgi:hypothetical protein